MVVVPRAQPEKLRLCVPSELNPPANVQLIEDVNGLARVEDFFQRKKVFGLDTETNMTNTFYNRRVRTIQVGDREEQYVIDLLAFAGDRGHLCDCREATPAWLSPIIDVFKPVLESREWLKVGQNLQFEYEMFKWNLGLRPWHFWDTLLAEKVYYCGAVDLFAHGFWALDDLVARYLGLYISKEEQTSFDLETPLTEKQVMYAGLDTRWPMAIMPAQQRKLVADGLMRTAQIEFDAIPAFGDMRLNGMLLDVAAWTVLYHENVEKKTAVVKLLDEIFLPIVGRKTGAPDLEELGRLEEQWRNEKDKTKRAANRKAYMALRKNGTEFRHRTEKGADKFEGDAAINYGANKQLLDAMHQLKQFNKTNLPDTSKQTIKKLGCDEKFKNDPVVKAVTDYRHYDKMIDTYGLDWPAQYVDKDSGRVHSVIHQLGAETGRTSSSKPNIQNLPRDKRYRACFIARPGYRMLTADYSAAELRILAHYSREPVWLAAFNRGEDLHSVCAEILLGDKWRQAAEIACDYVAKKVKCSCETHEKYRNWIKAINFGIAYGMTARRLALELGISVREAEMLLKAFFGAFAIVVAFLAKAAAAAISKMEARTLAGRRRSFQRPTPEMAARVLEKELKRAPTGGEIGKKVKAMFASIEREGKNTPIQGTNADMIKLAIGCGFDAEGTPYMWHRLEPEFDGLLENLVHDECVAEAPEEKAEGAMGWVQDCMSRAGAEFVNSVPMPTEGKVALHWTK